MNDLMGSLDVEAWGVIGGGLKVGGTCTGILDWGRPEEPAGSGTLGTDDMVMPSTSALNFGNTAAPSINLMQGHTDIAYRLRQILWGV